MGGIASAHQTFKIGQGFGAAQSGTALNTEADEEPKMMNPKSVQMSFGADLFSKLEALP